MTYAVDMISQDSIALTGDPIYITIRSGAPRIPGDTIEIAIAVTAGWNLVSVPVSLFPAVDSVRTLFPGSLFSYMYDFSGGYLQRYRLAHGRAYGGKFSGAQVFRMRGLGYGGDTMNVSAGWNFVGAPFHPVAMDSIRTIPPGIIVSRYFLYSRGYTTGASEIRPGRGFIVKCSAAGRLIFPPDF
jgi:hypothetical protein